MVKGVVEAEIKRLDLVQYADRQCGTYRYIAMYIILYTHMVYMYILDIIHVRIHIHLQFYQPEYPLS